VGLRYVALKSLQLPSMSEKRTRLLVTQHVQGLPLSSVKEANQAVRVLWCVQLCFCAVVVCMVVQYCFVCSCGVCVCVCVFVPVYHTM
jgi:hypothetical protein